MECKNKPSIMLTDYEAYHFLKQIKSAQQRNTPTPLATITYEALRYLEDRPAAKMTAEQIKAAEVRYKALPFKLKPSYITQLINNPPQSVVDIQVILGESIHDKTEEDLQSILTISKEIFSLMPQE